MTWSIWNAPSDRDYYEQLGPRWPEDPEHCHECGAAVEEQPHEPWCPENKPSKEAAPRGE